jgi:hypothetical protein
MDAMVREHLDKTRKKPHETDAMVQVSTPRLKLVRCPFEIGNRVGGVKSSRGFESHPLRFFLCLQVKRSRRPDSRRGPGATPGPLYCNPSAPSGLITSLVKPCATFGSSRGSRNDSSAVWACMSMNPGQSIRSVASIACAAFVVGKECSIVAIRSPAMPTSVCSVGLSPGNTLAPLIQVSSRFHCPIHTIPAASLRHA